MTSVRRLWLVVLWICIVLVVGCSLPNRTPIARATATPDEGDSPMAITFNAAGSSDPDGQVAHYAWDFGDGSTGTGKLLIHTYIVEQDTTFQVTLTVTDEGGLQDSHTFEITVRAPAGTPAPAVRFTWPFHYDASGEDEANLNDEYFAIENAGRETVDLTGWSVENERGLAYVFPDGYELAPGGIVFIHSGSGIDRADALYWHAAGPVWHNTSDIAILRDPSGRIVDHYAYFSC